MWVCFSSKEIYRENVLQQETLKNSDCTIETPQFGRCVSMNFMMDFLPFLKAAEDLNYLSKAKSFHSTSQQIFSNNSIFTQQFGSKHIHQNGLFSSCIVLSFSNRYNTSRMNERGAKNLSSKSARSTF